MNYCTQFRVLLTKGMAVGVMSPGGPGSTPAVDEVRTTLSRILESPQFRLSARLRRFLSFVVEETLAGRGDALKESAIGVAVYDRAPAALGDSPIVRVDAGRVRERLGLYYADPAVRAPCVIEIPKGTYSPRFRRPPPAAAAREAEPGGAPLIPTLAVLPFGNLDGSNSITGQALALDVLTKLSAFHEIRTLARGATWSYPGGTVDAVAVGRQIGAQFVVDGSVRRDAGTLRATCHLVDAATGRVLWGEHYDLDLAPAGSLVAQDEITSQIVAQIAGFRGVLARARAAGNDDQAIYDAMVAYVYELSAETHARALALLRPAVERRPASAGVWAGLSFLYSGTVVFGYPAPGLPSAAAAVDACIGAAERAMQLDAANPWVLHARFIAHFTAGEMALCRDVGERALRLNSHNTIVLGHFGVLLTFMGDWERGLECVATALRLDPDPPGWYWTPLFWDAYRRGHDTEAHDLARRLRTPHLFWTQVQRAAAAGQTGDAVMAADAVARLLALRSDFPACARQELARWFPAEPALAERVLEGLRRAGLAVA